MPPYATRSRTRAIGARVTPWDIAKTAAGIIASTPSVQKAAYRIGAAGARSAYNWVTRPRSRGKIGTRQGSYSTRRPMNMKRKAGKLLKKCKRVKPPKKSFVAKVNKVIDMDTPQGVMHFYNNGCEYLDTRNIQLVRVGPGRAVNSVQQPFYNDFSWQSIFAAVNIMYKNNPVEQAPTYHNSGFDNTTNFQVPNGAAQFEYDTKVFVESATVTYTVKNNMNVHVKVTHYSCFPRTTDGENPEIMWSNAIRTAYPAPNLKTNRDQGAVGRYPYSTQFGDYVGDKPTNYPLFNAKYRVVPTTKTLAPGQSMVIKRIGACQTWYDFAKARPDNLTNIFYQNQPGKNQWSMFVYTPVILNEEKQKLQAHRFGKFPLADSLEGTMIIEHERYFKIRCPTETAIADKENVLVRHNWVQATSDNLNRTFVQGKVNDNRLVV